MKNNKNDFFGGMFDFNGDGKTDLGEQWVAFKIFEDCTKNNNDNNTRYTSTKTRPIKEPTVVLIPEHPTESQYKSIKKSIKADYFITLIAATIMMFPVIAFNWAAIATHDPKNNASGFIIVLFLIVGVIITCIIGNSVSNDFKSHSARLKQLENNYKNNSTQNDSIIETSCEFVCNFDKTKDVTYNEVNIIKPNDLTSDQQHENYNAYVTEQRLKSLIGRIENGEVWDEQAFESAPEFVNFTFTYPNGKRGDIDMFIANELGEIQQIGATEYTVTISTKERDKIALLLFIYVVKWSDEPRTEFQEFMYQCNLFHRLRQECDDFMRADANRQNHPLRNRGRELASRYIEAIRNKRKEIYTEIVEKGLSTNKWVSEQKAYMIVKLLFPDAIYQYTADWLKEQSLDIFIPSINIAIEYQGLQHYRAIDFFGGEVAFEKTKKRDEIKRKKCSEQGVILIEWKFNEPLSEEFIKSKIEDSLSEK